MRISPHILHVAQPVEGGVARVVTDLVEAQLAAGLRVTVACPAGGSLTSALRAPECTVLRWDATRSPGHRLPGEVRRLARILRDVRPHLVHAHSAKAGLAARLAVRGGVPTVFQPHAWSFEAADGVVARLALGWERFGARWVTRVVCVSEAERRTGQRHGINAVWRVVPNGVDTLRFRPGAADDGAFGAGPLVVCVGRLCRQKGQDVLLEAWPRIRESVPGACLALVGEGPWQERLSSIGGEGVVLVGNSPDPRNWYAAADVVVVPSRWEGMALVPLEAGASGRSVVITDVAGAREAVLPGTGAVVPAEDPTALAEAVGIRLRDRAATDREGAAARRHVVEDYGLTASGARMLEVYGEVLDEA
jgi:glycosyltransferase involved in cell wall biosynthesis